MLYLKRVDRNLFIPESEIKYIEYRSADDYLDVILKDGKTVICFRTMFELLHVINNRS